MQKLCENHPGLSRYCLERIQRDFKIGENNITADNITENILDYIWEGKLSEKLINNVRCFINPSNIAASMKIELAYVYELIKMMLLKIDGILNLILVRDFDSNLYFKLSDCFAFVISEDGYVSFSCLLVEYYYRREWVKFATKVESPRSSTLQYPVDLSSKSILDIFIAILKEFEISSFQNYYSCGTNNLMKEAMWQHHFFHACWKFFPKMIHPEVGACFGTKGINSLTYRFVRLLSGLCNEARI